MSGSGTPVAGVFSDRYVNLAQPRLGAAVVWANDEFFGAKERLIDPTAPVFVPIVASLGLDPVWFCVLLLIQLELGGITPPFGVLLFVMKGVRPELPMRTIWSAAGPIVALQILLCALVTLFPGLTSWLPTLMNVPQ